MAASLCSANLPKPEVQKSMRTFLLGAFAGALVFAFAAVGIAQELGIGAAAFLRRGVDARALGMAGAFSAVAEGYSAMYWNPGGLARTSSPELGGMYMNLYNAGIHLNFFAGVLGLDLAEGTQTPSETMGSFLPRRLGGGLAFTEMATEVLAYDLQGNPLGLIRYSEAIYSLGLGAWIPRLGYAGAVAKVYSFRAPRAGRDGGDATAFGLGFDLGLSVPVWNGLWLGLSAMDVGNTKVKWRNTALEPTDLVSGRYTLGLAFTASGLAFENDRLLLALDAAYEPLVDSLAVRAGLEYTLFFVSLRAGAVWRPGVPWAFTFGAGIRALSLRLDAALVQNREIQAEGAGDTLVLSAAILF